MRKIRCKMQCHTKSSHSHTPGMVNVTLGAVYSPEKTGQPDDENAIFGKLTPSGHFSATMVEESSEILEVGTQYYVEMFLADEA
jgi:hypothetical protein